MTRKLRAIDPGEVVPKPPRRKTMTEAAATGDDLALFEALRTRLVESLNDARTPAHAVAPLARTLAQTTEQIDRLVRQQEADASTEAVAGDEAWDSSAI
jgi:hypothetical protein